MSAPKVYESMSAIAKEVATVGIGKERRNQSQNYNFRGIDDVQNLMAPLLAKHHLLMLPEITKRECIERTSKSGGAMFYTVVDVTFCFISSEDGSKHCIKTVGEAMDSADKGTNKAMSAAYKYAAIQAFCIPTEGTPDADGESPEVISRQSPNQKEWGTQPEAKEEVKINKAEVIKNLGAWIYDVLNPETFQRTDDTVLFTAFRDQLVKDGAGLSDAELLKIRKEAYFNWLLCMITTADPSELTSKKWETAIEKSQLGQGEAHTLQGALAAQHKLVNS